MDVSIETTGAIGRRMTVKVPAEQLDGAVAARLKRLARTAKIPGFRPGKIPMKVIESRFADQALAEAADEIISASYMEAINGESLDAAGPPAIEPKNLARGEDLEFIANFEVFPEVPRTDIRDLPIDRQQCEVVDADIDRTIETLREQRTSFETVDKAAETGDRVVIDFEGRVAGEAFEGGEAKDYPVVLGKGALLAEFESGITGARAGEDLTIQLTFPEDYPGAQVAGKEAEFAISVKEVGAPEVPEIDEDFIRTFGVEDGSKAAFRQEIRTSLERERDQRARVQIRQAVLEALMRDNEFEVPSALVDEEINRAIMAVRQQLQQQGLPHDAPIDRANYLDESYRRVRLGLAMHGVVKRLEIKPDPDRVRERVVEMGSSYSDPDQFVRWYYEDKNRLAQIESVIVEEQAVEALLEEAKINDTTVSFEKFVRPQSPATVAQEASGDTK
ncbi:MAG TPA: trigger factor [Gammaproteobacteria bacterium]|jgi:trigger factor|nr:trigger factor [Arenicellales bacterium]MDP6552684.1 trigger factor [Arenicellales bacterium]MDP6791230.1 trigger factor [Arenicellales bacterium]MDP6917847.1 trigger factor [Arenicellales bacterium]HCX88776.1 trigger factor [Gammaproteobacteria bacterium]|tara:strand:- start:26057 stop:27397 length:1341 start_codon:yes stop_codon:yes gene_type:complete